MGPARLRSTRARTAAEDREWAILQWSADFVDHCTAVQHAEHMATPWLGINDDCNAAINAEVKHELGHNDLATCAVIGEQFRAGESRYRGSPNRPRRDAASQLRTERIEQPVWGQSELGQQSDVRGFIKVDPVGQTSRQGVGIVGSVSTADDAERVGLGDNGHGGLDSRARVSWAWAAVPPRRQLRQGDVASCDSSGECSRITKPRSAQCG